MFDISKRAAELDRLQDELAAEQKASAADFKARLNANEAERKQLSRLIRDEKKIVQSECTVENDFVNRFIFFRSVETNQIVKERKMTDLEYSLPSVGEQSE
jgi:hypothetical protein